MAKRGLENLPLLVKIILALPVLDIVWVIHRLLVSISKKSVLGIILAIVLIIVGIPFLWLVDIITLIITGKVIWF